MNADWRQTALLVLAAPVILPLWLATAVASAVMMVKYRLTHPRMASSPRLATGLR